MEKLIFNFKGYWNCDSRCLVYKKTVDGITYICFEDIGVGTSVTNASETIATEFVKQFNLDPEKCRFYETYTHNEDIDNVIYDWNNGVATSPKWRPIYPEEWEILSDIK